MRLTLISLFGLFCIILVNAGQTFAQDETVCPVTDAEYYNPSLAATMHNGAFSLMDANTNTRIAMLDDGVLQTRPADGYDINVGYTLRWGENCRYIYLVNHWRDVEPYPERHTAIYDTQTFSRIALFRGVETHFRLVHSPDQRHVYIQSATGNYLLTHGWSQPVLLADYQPTIQERIEQGEPNVTGYAGVPVDQALKVEWDLTRKLFYVVFRNDFQNFYAYNIDSGALQYTVPNPSGCYVPLTFQIVNDNQYALVYSRNRIRGIASGTVPTCVTVVNLDTNARQVADAGIVVLYEPDQIALSPDGRYLVTGMYALRVWDLTEYTPDAWLEPMYRHEAPLSVIGSVQFVNATTVETTSEDGTQRWNILTGELIP